MTMPAKEAAKVLREESARIEKHGHILCSGPTAQTVKQAIDAAVSALEAGTDVDGERYRLLRTLNWNDSPLCCVADPKASVRLGYDCPSGDRLDEKLDALLAIKNQHPSERALSSSRPRAQSARRKPMTPDRLDLLATTKGGEA